MDLRGQVRGLAHGHPWTPCIRPLASMGRSMDIVGVSMDWFISNKEVPVCVIGCGLD